MKHLEDANQDLAKKTVGEWSFDKNLNPFNSLKIMAHLERWSFIKRGMMIPPPVLVTVDPTNECNYNCIWCNFKVIINKKSRRKLSKVALKEIAKALSDWEYERGKYGVKAVCVAGGGEPLLNSEIGFFIDNLVDKGIEVGVVTNGSNINNFIESLAKCHWVSVSIDSGTADTFADLKKVSLSEFNRVIENMRALVEYSLTHSTYLAQKPLSFGVIYKFLAHEKNVHEIDIATKLAKEIGCKGIHIRPVGKPWYSKEAIPFDNKTISMFYDKLRVAREMEDENFSVYGVTHKFNSDFSKKNNFDKCHALFMTTVFSPPASDDYPDSFTLCQCCDRRGDSALELSGNLRNLEDILRLWGGVKHWEMYDRLDLSSCPNCHFRGLGDKEIPFELLDNIVRFIKPKAITIAGGGEPTLYSNFDKAILKLAKISNVKIGLITNGVFIPKGLWQKCIDWVRVSVYSIEDGKYSGRDAEFYWKVLGNVEFCLKHCLEIPHIGVHFLFYRKNMLDVIPFIKDMYLRYKNDSKVLERMHIQFKPAFLMSRPTQLTQELHEENINFLPDKEQLIVFLGNLKDEFRRYEGLESFLRRKSNIDLFFQLINGDLNGLINITDPENVFVKNLDECSVCLAYQLIAPDGYVYPCLTLAEHRLHELSICNIADLPNCDSNIINNFRKIRSEWCNPLFCRNWEHNMIVKKYLDRSFDFDVSNNNFF